MSHENTSLYDSLRRSLLAEERVCQITRIDGGDELGAKMLVWADGRRQGSLGNEALDERAAALATDPAAATGPVRLDETEARGELFVEVFAPHPKLIVVGAVHVAIHLIHFAKRLGFRTIVVDARSTFATRERFPHADELVVRWPAEALAEMSLHDNTYCVFLTHDPKLDNPALVEACRAPVRYIGALGSKRTHAKRVEALREAGLERAQIERIHAPIGLDLGGRRPEEIALSIAAQLVQARHHRT